MKTYRSEPTTEVRVVKPDSERLEYEVWVLVPQRIGGMRKVATAEYRTEDGDKGLANIEECTALYLDRAGHKDLARVVRIGSKQDKPVTISGLDMVGNGKWLRFCELRKLNPKDVKQMQKDFILSPSEAAKLEIQA